jgi:multiple sugar transport system permease protein
MKSKRSIIGTIILLSWAVVSIWPIWYFATIALRPRVEIIAPDPIYWPTFTMETWAKIWEEWPMMKYFFNSIAAVAGSVFICLLLGIPAAYSLARYRYKGREDIGNYILSTKMMAPVVVAIPLYVLFAQMRMLDTVWALMLVYAAINLSIVVWIIRSAT